MDYIFNGFISAIHIILSFDSEFIEIVLRSVSVSLTATAIASVAAVPFFMFLGLRRFWGEGIVSRLLNTFMSIPTVVVGLVVMLLLARRGPFGHLDILYSIKAMVIAQTILVYPLVAAMTYELAKQSGRTIVSLAHTLGAGPLQTTALVIAELKNVLLIYMISAFSRAISEVGAVMMVGGNIKGQTNVMTTTISRYNAMGEYEMAMALGVILLLTSCVINWIAYSFREKSVKRGD